MRPCQGGLLWGVYDLDLARRIAYILSQAGTELQKRQQLNSKRTSSHRHEPIAVDAMRRTKGRRSLPSLSFVLCDWLKELEKCKA
jgi:hypothetical protein